MRIPRILAAALATAWLLLISAVALAADSASVYLTDGSIVRGQLTSIAGGRYTIVTEALGTVSVDQQRVARVEFNRDQPAAAAAPSPAPADLSSLQGRMLADPRIMALLERLSSDPALRAAAADPEVQRAIASGDYASLMNNPRMIELMHNDAVRAVTRELQ